jgi:DNA-directed RNA polymerase specialized sigma24 family protein
MGKYAIIDNIFGTDDEEETGANDAFEEEEDDDDESGEESDDEDDEDDEDEDDDPLTEDDAMLARLDKAYRALRARVRAVSDLSELRTMRSEHTAALAGRQSPTLRLRTLDIIEAIDDHVTNLRASRGGPRSQ